MATLQAPAGTTSLSYEGVEYKADKNGRIEVPDHLVNVGKPFGFVQVYDEPNDPETPEELTADSVAKMKRVECLMYLDEHQLPIPPGGVDKLREAVWKNVEALANATESRPA